MLMNIYCDSIERSVPYKTHKSDIWEYNPGLVPALATTLPAEPKKKRYSYFF